MLDAIFSQTTKELGSVQAKIPRSIWMFVLCSMGQFNYKEADFSLIMFINYSKRKRHFPWQNFTPKKQIFFERQKHYNDKLCQPKSQHFIWTKFEP